MKNKKPILLSLLLILVVLLVTGCGAKGKVYYDTTSEEFLTYEISGEKLILTDTEGISPSPKGSTWTYKRVGEGTGVVGTWACEKSNLVGEGEQECNETIKVVETDGRYLVTSEEEESEEEVPAEELNEG